MTDGEAIAGLAIQLTFWFVCLMVGALITYPTGEGVIVGHIVGVGCALFGIPARFILKD